MNCVHKGSSLGVVTTLQAGQMSSCSMLGSAKEFFFHQSIQPGSGTHQASSSVDTRGCPKGEVAVVQS
jgi:hypothetical protein